MLTLLVSWELLLFAVIRPFGTLVTGAAIAPSSAWVDSAVVPVELDARSTPHLMGRGPKSQINKRDGLLPAALVNTFQSSSWIWSAETDAPNAPAADRAFRRTFITPQGKVATFALVLLSVDDRFSFFVNGNLIGISPTTPDSWKNAHTYNVTLAAATNLFAIRGTNLPDVNSGGPSPAGVLAAIQVAFSDGSAFLFSSSSGWRTNKIVPSGFELPSFDDSQWTLASPLFKYGEGPWLSNVVLPTDTAPVTTSPAPGLPTPTDHPTTAPTPTNSNASGASPPVGAIAGGVVGGILLLLLVVFVLVWRTRRKNRPRRVRESLFPPSPGFELNNRSHSPPLSYQVEMIQPQITAPRVSHHAPSPSASSAYHSTISPSMSVSQVGQGSHNTSDGSEFRDRIDRLEGLVLELDREITLGGGGSRVAELRGAHLEATHQTADPFAGGQMYDARTRSIAPPAYEN